MANTPTIVSFYTDDEYYSLFAKRMANRIEALNLTSSVKFAHEIVMHVKAPGETWSQTCFKKPEYIRSWLDKYESIIWIDIDSTLHRLPTKPTDKILNPSNELAAVTRPDRVTVYDYLWYIKSTDTTKAMFDDIIKEIKMNYIKNDNDIVREGGDHDAVLKVLQRYKEKNPKLMGFIGEHEFGSRTGWATFGISGNEPSQGKKPSIAAKLRTRQKILNSLKTDSRIAVRHITHPRKYKKPGT